ncbi:carbohydrate sulfotransferase 1-like isoform X1 [Anneissia japonica]|uniref:carbohydrate sulfotransferase 1-like isoform X1 n=1 Tax=Anneissia japonica TaxID=1529436 RepID=UPI0014257C2A|nr:carbohydrate sulfotransferase 1-like isoform X1 [Anneissia japonica]
MHSVVKHIILLTAAIVFTSSIVLQVDRRPAKIILHQPTLTIHMKSSTKIRNEETARSSSDESDSWTTNNQSHIIKDGGDITSYQDAVDEQPKNIVIIVTNKRSGSSFFGELFNQNRNVFYAFEPLVYFTQMALKHQIPANVFDYLSIKTLKYVSTCDLYNIPYLNMWWETFRKFLCRSTHWSSLCKDNKLRKVSIETALDTIVKICNLSKLVAVKTIRLADIASLREFVEKYNINVKVLHLVRDPRAVMNSRWHLHSPNYDFLRKKAKVKDEIIDLCQHSVRNIKYVSSQPDWLRGRYKLVRFEDVASFPHECARQIYQFLGVEYPLVLDGWINENTNKDTANPYDTKRKSARIINKWRNEMDFNKVNEIQRKCPQAMTSLGYNLMNESQLVNVDNCESYLKPDELPFTKLHGIFSSLSINQ